MRFVEATKALAARMITRGPIDYEARRAALSTLREVPGRVLLPILKLAGLQLTWQRQRHVAGWLWEHLTGGEARDAPTYAEDINGVKEASPSHGHGFTLNCPNKPAAHSWPEERSGLR
ncbi:hypothetical protein [Streptomyces chartreusis]|uniref:Uncharacterized protein n=1 Tax=Streptomyces chartreusis TaxID=1969 RepID=A0A7H8T1Z9_STRCX|nr:hypothetical protein [Streptomyces chartreusis]QKZ17523.1 hypothetical protein HUT05_09280 [Streptomyces chartreusis]